MALPGETDDRKKTLRQIRRIACSDLPLYPFATTVLDLLEELIPSVTFSGFFSISPHKNCIIAKQVDLARWAPLWKRFKVWGTREEAGTLLYADLARFNKTVLTQDEFTLPGFHQSPGYEELCRPLGAEYFLPTLLRSRGEFLGYLNLVRPPDSRPFGPREIALMKQAAPFLSHGFSLRTGAGIPGSPDPGERSTSVVAGKPGLLILDIRGKILSIDRHGQTLLGQIDALSFDRRVPHATNGHPLARALEKVIHAIRAVDCVPDDDQELSLPEESFYVNAEGFFMSVRGYRMEGHHGEPPRIGVILEQRLSKKILLATVIHQYGLSGREGEILTLIEGGEPKAAIARKLAIRDSTFRTYLERILQKLGIGEIRNLPSFLSACLAPEEPGTQANISQKPAERSLAVTPSSVLPESSGSLR